MAHLRESWLLVGGAVRVHTDLAICGIPESVTTTGIEPKIPNPESALKSTLDFDSLLTSNFLSDITIQCGSELFAAHKAILAGRSDVFKTMLASDMEEVKSGVIHVTDVTIRALEIILRYIYTGNVKEDKLDSNSLLDIIHGAEKYALDELKQCCFRKLAARITDENAGA